MTMNDRRKSAHSYGGRCGGWMDRRTFLKGATVTTAALGPLGSALPVMAGPFDGNDYLEVIPQDKRLDPAWVRSLFERGRKDVYSEPAALAHIGMPVGGFFAGTLYLGGDGRLWLWDIFNRDQLGIQPRKVTYKGQDVNAMGGANYVEPARPDSPVDQGFGVEFNGRRIPLDATGFRTITFRGEYPRAIVRYRDARVPVTVELEAFSPFAPLALDESSLPATILQYTVTNSSQMTREVRVYGYLANPVCLYSANRVDGRLRNRIVRRDEWSALVCSAEPLDEPDSGQPRPDILFEDFEQDRYEGWTVEGKAFGMGPVRVTDIPDYQGDVNGVGQRVVNSHASAPGSSVGEKDSHTGTLTSRAFTIERKYIAFRIGGGAHKGQTCVNLLIDDKVVASATGSNNNRMHPDAFDVRVYEGQSARLQIVDRGTGAWGNIGVDQIVFTDRKPVTGTLEAEHDFGTIALGLLSDATSASDDCATASSAEPSAVSEAVGSFADRPRGEIGRRLRLGPGEQATVTFVVAWHFPNFYGREFGGRLMGHYYASRFGSALHVLDYVTQHFDRLAGTTRQWVRTWYDSTLPYWLLDRTMANTSTLATTTCYRFKDGRFWAWEGIGCCAGTCTHVWHYAQAPGRLFPELERRQRQEVDFGIGMRQDGGIAHRVWDKGRLSHPAHDGQCGRILGAYREHLMSPDDRFLKATWPRIKKALEYMIRLDGNADGMVEGAQPNTLDASWYGKISFLSSLYLAALRAGQAMATEMGDRTFARLCGTIADRGADTILELFNGEYFIQIEDPAHKDKIGVGPGCYIDQVFGQSWAHQVGLGYLFDRDKQRQALQALWKYNFVPDVGPFRERFTRGRWYAVAGDAGLLMCTWPRGGQNPNFKKHWQYMYFNECMSGFEWQAAAHMIAEGMLKEGLAVGRAIHDRYNAHLRNPYNEIECSDHYARAMASYGVFVAVTGFECHGPRGHMGFAPKLSPDDFRAAFVAAEGWGTFSQQRQADRQTETLEVRYGRLRLASLAFELPEGKRATAATVRVGQIEQPIAFEQQGRRVMVRLESAVMLAAPDWLEAVAAGSAAAATLLPARPSAEGDRLDVELAIA